MRGCVLAMVAALAFPAFAPGLAYAAQDPVFGRWVVENGKAVIEIKPCGDGEACGRLVWLANPFDNTGDAKRDEKNPQKSKRNRFLCRLPLIMGLMRVREGEWEDGEIYSTRDGKSFGFKIVGVEGDMLTVRGFLGVSLFGKTQTWTRDNGRRGNCVTMHGPGPSDER